MDNKLANNIKETANKVIEQSVADFEHWYLDSFESDTEIEKEEDLTSGEFSEDEISYAKNDWIYCYEHRYIAKVCTLLNIESESDISEENDKLLYEVLEIVREALRVKLNV